VVSVTTSIVTKRTERSINSVPPSLMKEAEVIQSLGFVPLKHRVKRVIFLLDSFSPLNLSCYIISHYLKTYYLHP
jgi:hypothetical protein